MISDHGDSVTSSRVYSVLPEDIMIPYWFYIPRKCCHIFFSQVATVKLTSTERDALEKNKERLVTTVDVYPTLIDLLQVMRQDLVGYSLKVAGNRQVLWRNTPHRVVCSTPYRLSALCPF